MFYLDKDKKWLYLEKDLVIISLENVKEIKFFKDVLKVRFVYSGCEQSYYDYYFINREELNEFIDRLKNLLLSSR